MSKLQIVAIAAMLAIVPATANAKSEGSDKTWDQYSDLLTQKGQNREPGPNSLPGQAGRERPGELAHAIRRVIVRCFDR